MCFATVVSRTSAALVAPPNVGCTRMPVAPPTTIDFRIAARAEKPVSAIPMGLSSNWQRSIVAASGVTTPGLVASDAPVPLPRKIESRTNSSAGPARLALSPAPVNPLTSVPST